MGTLTGTRAYVCRPKPNDGVNNWPAVSTLSDCVCPKCSTKLRVESAQGVDGVDLLVCTKCWGLAVQAKTMQGVVPDEVREKIEDTGLKHTEGHSCPICPATMLEIGVPKPFGAEDRASEHDVIVDVCGDCATVWFDVGELDALNGIKPKLQNISMKEGAEKIEAQVDTSSPSLQMRKAGGALLLLAGLGWALRGGWIAGPLGLLLAIGGGILVLTKSPETGLERGLCSRCDLEGMTIGWTCQRGGCEAPICTTCRSVGQDPAAQYVKTLGGGALMVAGVVLGVGLLVVTEGALAEAGFYPAAAGYELISEDDDEKGLLVCRECTKDMGALQFPTGESKDMEEMHLAAKMEAGNVEEHLKSQTHCVHVDEKTDRKCRRMVYRKSGYCYVHQQE